MEHQQASSTPDPRSGHGCSGLSFGVPSQPVFAALMFAMVAAPSGISLCPPADGELENRIRGQVADLATPVEWLEPPCATGRPASPTIVIRGTAEAGYAVEIQEDNRRRYRHFGPLRSASATREATAVAVRSLIRVIALGLQPDWPEAPPAPTPPAVIAQPTDPADDSRDPWRLRASAGFEGRLTGIGDPAYAVGLRVGMTHRRWLFELGASFGLTRELEDSNTRLQVAEHNAHASVSFVAWQTERFDARFGGGGGLSLHTRQADALSSGVSPSPPGRHFGAVFTVETRLGWRFFGPAGTGLELLVAGDGLTGAPRLLYRTENRDETRAEAWRVRPRVGLVFSVDVGQW